MFTPSGWARLALTVLAPVLIAAGLMGVGAYATVRFVADPLRAELAENRKALEAFRDAVKDLRPGETRLTVNPATGTSGETRVIERDRTTVKTETTVRDQIPSTRVEKARARARKVVTVDLNPEALVPSFQAHKRIELIEDPGTGAFSAAANPVVASVTTTQTLALPRSRLLSWEPYLAVGYIAGGAELGIGTDILHLGNLSFGADLRVARWAPGEGQSVSLGLYHIAATASWPIAGSLRAQIGYAYPLRHDLPGGSFVGVSLRF